MIRKIKNIIGKMSNPTRHYYHLGDGERMVVTYFNRDGLIHRRDGPAVIRYRRGSVEEEIWFCRGERHSWDGPAYTKYNTLGHKVCERFYEHGKSGGNNNEVYQINYSGGVVADMAYNMIWDGEKHTYKISDHPDKRVEYWDDCGNVVGSSFFKYIYNGEAVHHCVDGPAMSEYYENGDIKFEKYFNGGETHRTDGPAVIRYYHEGVVQSEGYNVNGKLHRTDGPAVIEYSEFGKVERESYYFEGERHNINGPAVVEYYKGGDVLRLEKYCLSGKFHRTDGPAAIWYDGKGNVIKQEYWSGGIMLSEHEWLRDYKHLSE